MLSEQRSVDMIPLQLPQASVALPQVDQPFAVGHMVDVVVVRPTPSLLIVEILDHSGVVAYTSLGYVRFQYTAHSSI